MSVNGFSGSAVDLDDKGMQRGINWREFKITCSGKQIGWARIEQSPRTCLFTVTYRIGDGPIGRVKGEFVNQERAIKGAQFEVRRAVAGGGA
jgi:hypothetical protein